MAELRPSVMVAAGLSGVVGGVLGSAVVMSVLSIRGETRVEPERAVAAEKAAFEALPLDGRVAALERSLQSLSLREGLARSAAKAKEAASSDGRAEEPAVADVAPIVDDPVFEAAVRDVMDRAEQERNLERESERAEWRKQVAEEWANDVTEKLRLTEMQKTKALAVASGFWDSLRELRQRDAGPSLTRQEWRARVDELRTGAEAELAKALSPAQMTAYRELEESSRLGSRRSLRGAGR